MLRWAIGVALLLVAIVACSDDKPTPASASPTRGDGGDGEEDFSAGVSIQCAGLESRIDIVKTTLDDLDEKGGTIADGKWVLTASALIDDEGDPDAGTSVVGQKAATLSFAGKEVAWASDTDVFGNAKNDCCRGTYTIEGNELTMQVRCTDGNEIFVFPFGADATTLRLRTNGNEYIDTYAKR